MAGVVLAPLRRANEDAKLASNFWKFLLDVIICDCFHYAPRLCLYLTRVGPPRGRNSHGSSTGIHHFIQLGEDKGFKAETQILVAFGEPNHKGSVSLTLVEGRSQFRDEFTA